MATRLLALSLLLALRAAPALAAADAPGADAPPEKDRAALDYAIRAVGGYFDGMGVRTDSGGLAVVELDLTPKFRSATWEIDLPLRFDHQQTFGADLNETVLGAELDMWMTGVTGARHGPLAGVSYTRRADWPDLYQRTQAGALASTDRYSYFQLVGGWQYWNKLGEGRNLRAKLRYVHTQYPRDPNYSEADSVVHLAPRDNGTVKLDTSYRAVKEHFAYAVKLDGYFRQDLVLLAKNANTGGTSRSNPRQRLLGIEPQAEIELRSKLLDVTIGYGLLAQSDRFEGYYSYTGHRPYAEAKLTVNSRLTADLRAEAKLITYGSNSKADTEDGKTLRDTRYALKGGLRYKLLRGLFLVADASATKRETNFRDYGPDAAGVWYPTDPPSQPDRYYVIDWDYTNFMATAGVEWKP